MQTKKIKKGLKLPNALIIVFGIMVLAMVIMPIMAPLADVVGVTRQAAVTAFQLGDGLSNVIFPTSGTLMACLAIAGVDFKKWVKWVFLLFTLWTLMGTIAIILVVASGVA